MIRIVTTTGYRHDKEVKKEVNRLQRKGYNVYDVKRVSRMVWLFGYDTSHIYYKDKNENTQR